MKNMYCGRNKAALAVMLIAGTLYADKVTIYNGSGKSVAVTIIQGVWKGTEFKAHPGTMQVGQLPKGQVSIFELRNGENAVLDRPNRTLGKDTVLVVYSDAEYLARALTDKNGATFDRQSAYTIGQIGNKELFIGSADASEGPSRPLATLTGPNVVLYKVDKTNVTDKDDWSQRNSLGSSITVTGDQTQSTLTRAKKSVKAIPDKLKASWNATLKNYKKKKLASGATFNEKLKQFYGSLTGKFRGSHFRADESSKVVHVFVNPEARQDEPVEAYSLNLGGDEPSSLQPEFVSVQEVQEYRPVSSELAALEGQ